MLRKIGFSLTPLFMLLALLVLPSVAHAAELKSSTDVHFAFAAQTTSGAGSGTVFTGDLALHIAQSTGTVQGTLSLPGKVNVPVAGVLSSFNQMTLYFFLNKFQNTFIKGQGTLTNSNEYTGTFQQFTGINQTGSGVWSALQVATTKTVNTYAYMGNTTSGSSAGAQFNAALTITKATGFGYANLPDGTLIPVSFFQLASNVTITFYLPNNTQIVAQGTASGSNLAGTFTSVQGLGIWNAYKVGFSF